MAISTLACPVQAAQRHALCSLLQNVPPYLTNSSPSVPVGHVPTFVRYRRRKTSHCRGCASRSIRYDTIRDAVLTCARKPTWVSLTYRTETTTKRFKTEKLKSKNGYARSNSKSLGNHVVSLEEEKERLQWEGFAENEGFKSGMKEREGDGKLIIISITVRGINDQTRFYS